MKVLFGKNDPMSPYFEEFSFEIATFKLKVLACWHFCENVPCLRFQKPFYFPLLPVSPLVDDHQSTYLTNFFKKTPFFTISKPYKLINQYVNF